MVFIKMASFSDSVIQQYIFTVSAVEGLPQLIFTDGRDVRMADIHGRLVRTLVQSPGKGYAVGVAYHWHRQQVFWSDTNAQKVSIITTIFYFP